MKNKVRIFFAVVIFAGACTGCSKNDELNVLSTVSLKRVMDENAVDLNSAVNTIKASKLYNVLTMTSDVATKSAADDYSVHITMDTVKGVYEYNNSIAGFSNWNMPLIHYFNKTANSGHMIVEMPLKKITKPFLLRHPVIADTALDNNFRIDVSGYHNNYNSFHDYDYLLSSEITIDEEIAGNLNIKSRISPDRGKDYHSSFEFSGKYKSEYRFLSGDTTISSFTISDDENVLYGEKLIITRNDSAMFGHEKQYILTIGEIQIVRKSFDDVSILVNGVAQPGAVVTIVDSQQDSEASICKHRDVQITFEDGSVVLLSDLISDSVDDIRMLYSSLHNVYLAAYIVDWLGYDIYYKR